MSRSMLIRLLSMVLLLATAVGSTSAQTTSDPPNIVLILADDLGWGELGSYGQQMIRTPHLDRLARQGMRFTQHYSGAPVCAPSRCVLMTGKHLGHAEIRGNRAARDEAGKAIEGQHPITADAVTIAEVLKSRGYATGAMGKWGLGPVQSTGAPHHHGFDLFFGYNCQAVAHSYFPPHLWRNSERIVINPKRPVPGHAKQPEGEVTLEAWFGEAYAPDLMVGEAIRFLKQNSERRFFLYLPFIEPHVSMHPPRAMVDSYPREWDDRPYRGQCGYIPHPRPRAGYAAMITSLDDHVGRVMATLAELGLDNDTLVLFSSDNGTTHPHRGDEVFGVGGVDAAFFDSTANLRGYKGSVHEGGLRVPMIARWPGRIEPDSTSDFPSYFADYFPTLCQVAGADPPKDLDGISFLPTLTGQGRQADRNPMVWVFPEYGGQVAVRVGAWKVVRKNLRTNKPGPWELYNLESDPAEADDVSESHPDIVRQAREILREQTDDNPLFPVAFQ